MKKLLLSAILMTTCTSFAKLAVYSNSEALKTVLSSSEVMSKINEQVNYTELTSTQISSTGEGTLKKFTVRMTFTAKTPIGDRSCYLDVALESKPSSKKLPGGAVIAVNTLEVQKISKNICQK